jgi:hypothetical protein
MEWRRSVLDYNKSCSLRVTSETCGRCRGDLDGQKSLGDKGESQGERRASWWY